MGEFIELFEEPADRQLQRYYGKYRGLVVDDLDPEQAGRVRVRVPEVLGETDAWAVASWPPGSSPEEHVPPAVGTEVWVEFEHGDLAYPIWSGLL